MDIFYEGFDGLFWDFKVGKFVDGVFMYSPSASGCDGDEWVSFPSVILMVFTNGSYLVCLCPMAWSINLSWQYVNSMYWVVIVGEGVIWVGVLFSGPRRHSMSGRSLARHRHGGCRHVHLRSHWGIV